MKKIYIVILFLTVLYFFTISNTIFGGDSGDLVSAVLTNGSAHPPGYPLYVLIGILFKYLPLWFLTAAGKVSLVSTISTILSILLSSLIIKEISDKKYLNYYLIGLTALVIGVNYLIWLYAIVPEVFPLNAFITLTIFYLSIKIYKIHASFWQAIPSKSGERVQNHLKHIDSGQVFRQAQDTEQSRSARVTKFGLSLTHYLYLLALFIGLGISHHHTFVLVIPSVLYLLYLKRKNIKIKLSQSIKIAGFFLAGFLPLIYLIYTGFAQSPVLWGNTNTVSGFFSTLLRMRYGTFVAAPIIQTTPQQRLAQLNNLFTFFKDDFSLMGIVFFILAIIFYIKLKKSNTKTLLTALIINIVSFGPFFVFYANFPLLNGYYLATLERFLIVSYFFSAIMIYFGLYYFVNNILNKIIKSYLHNLFLKKFTFAITIILLFLYPAGLFLKSFPTVYALKNDRMAENLGQDVLSSIPKNSIFILSSDNLTFDTQYIYHNQSKKIKDKVLVHLGKFGFFDYLNNLKSNYPQLDIKPNKKTRDKLTAFILNNIDKMSIYSELPLNLPDLKQYEWVPQGIVFKLEKKEQISKFRTIKALEEFWQNSLNKNLVQQVQKDDLKFRNLFTADILKIYSGSHKDTAIYLLNNNKLNQAHQHLVQARELEKYDPILNTGELFSIYYEKKGDCSKAEAEITQVLSQAVTINFLKTLNNIGLNCYKDEADKKKIGEKLKQYVLKNNVSLKDF